MKINDKMGHINIISLLYILQETYMCEFYKKCKKVKQNRTKKDLTTVI